jgi:ribosomal protein S18 acetylase RimI-like enzyme
VTRASLRPALPTDAEFLFALMKAALGPYVIATFGPWNEAAQREKFFSTLKLSLHSIVEQNAERIGCLNVERRENTFKLNRIFLLPSHQGRGIGEALMRDLMREADAAQLPIRLRVMRANPARRFYERLGFVVTGEIETHFLMERAPTRR